MSLYQEILFLKHYFKGAWVVENVIPYYEPLIPGNKRGRHLYWSSFAMPMRLNERKFAISATKNEVDELSKFHDYDFRQYKGEQRLDKMARNLVDYEVGKSIFMAALDIEEAKMEDQFALF